MFVYCLNNPIIYVDYTGNNGLAITLGFLSSLVQPLALLVAATCIVVAVVAITWEVGSWINEELRSYQWHTTTEPFSTTDSTAAVPLTVEKVNQSLEQAQVKAQEKVKKNRKQIHYWVAAYDDFGDGRGTYLPTVPLSYTQAIYYVRAGGSVFADSRRNAYKLAIAVGQGNPNVIREIHGEAYNYIGYWKHYHAGGHKGGHIFYV